MATPFWKQNSCLPAQTPTTKSIKSSTSFIAALILAIASLVAPQLTGNFYQHTAATAHAETLTVTGDQYIDATDGHPSIQTIPADAPKTTLAADTTTWNQNNGWYIADSSIKLEDSRVTVPVNTTVNLLLKNNITLTIPKGIEMTDGATLNIYAQTEDNSSMGKLVIDNVDEHKAGIGTKGSNTPRRGSNSSFSINIHGGSINTTGGNFGAGIGSGASMSAGNININIHGGNTNARGGDLGAGIGSGAGITGGTVSISIHGGNTNTTGGNFGAGIGSGPGMSGGTININAYGGTTTTAGGTDGAGIGSGTSMQDGTIKINIHGGIINTTSKNAAKLGSGTNKDSTRASVKITLKQGLIIINNDALGQTETQGTYTNSYKDTFNYEENPVIFTGGFTTDQAATKDFTLVENGTITGSKTLPANAQFLTGIEAEGGPQYGAETTFNYVIPDGKTLTIGENSTLTSEGKISVSQNGALTVAKNATVENNGELTNAGTITNNWKITGNGEFTNNKDAKVNPFKPTQVRTNLTNNKATASVQPVPFTPAEFNFDGDGWGTTTARTYNATDTSTHTVRARVNHTQMPAWAAAFYTESEPTTFNLAQPTPQQGVGFDTHYEQGTITPQQGYEIKETSSQNITDQGTSITVEPGKTYQVRQKAADGLNASAWVDIPAFTFQTTPSIGAQRLTFTNPTGTTAPDGKITGQTNVVYEYREVPPVTVETNWTEFTTSQIGLVTGDYQVRIKGDKVIQKMPSAPVTISLRYIKLQVTPNPISASYNNTTAHPITVTNKGEDSITITAAALTAADEGNTKSKFDFTPAQSSVLLAPNTSTTIGNITPKNATNLNTDNYGIQLQLTLNGKGINPAGETRTETLTYQVAAATQPAPAKPIVTASAVGKLEITAPADSAGKTVLYCVQPVGNNIFTTVDTDCTGSWVSETDAEAVDRTPATSYAIWAKYAAIDNQYAQSPASLQQIVTTKPNATAVATNNIDYVHETIQNANKLEFATSSKDFGSNLVSGPGISSLISATDPTTLYVRVKANPAAGTPASTPVAITLPKRAVAPNVDQQDATYQGLNDGQITRLAPNKTYEYKPQDAKSNWTPATTGATDITGLAAGTYLVREAADPRNQKFASATKTITINKGIEQNSKLEAEKTIVFTDASFNYTQPDKVTAQVKPAANFNAAVKITAASIPDEEQNFTFTKDTALNNNGNISVAPNNSGAITVGNIQPKQGLTAGEYTTKIMVTYQATEGTDTTPKTIYIPVSFKVTEKTQQAPNLAGKITASATSINISNITNGAVKTAAKYCTVKVTTDNADTTDSSACGENWTSSTSIPAEAATSYKVFAFYPAVAGKYTDSAVSQGVLVTTPVTANTVLVENINYPAETLTVPAGSKLEFATSTNGFVNKESKLADGAKLTSIIDKTDADRVVYARVEDTNGLPASAATKVQLPARPTLDNLTAVAATSSNNQDGQITGLNPSYGYIYQKQGDQHWINQPHATTAITGLAAGTYLVTIPATNNRFAAKQPAQLKVTAATTTIGQLEIAQVTDTSITVTPLAADPTTGAKAEYSIDGGNTWNTTGIFTELNPATKYEITARYQNQPASGSTTTAATTNAAAPTTEQITGGSKGTGVINHENGTLNTNQENNLEFATSKNFDKDSILPEGSNLEDLAGQTIYARTKQNSETGAAASTPVEVKIPEKAATPTLGVTGYGKINGLTEGQGYQISTGTDPETENWNNLDPAAPLTPGVYQIRQTGSSKDNTLPSAPTTLVVTSPIGEVKVEETTDSSIRITPVPADPATGAKAEYSIDGGKTWQESNTFTGLEPASKHEIAVRYQLPVGVQGVANAITVTATTVAAAPSVKNLVDYTNQSLTTKEGEDTLEYSASPTFSNNTILAPDINLADYAGQTLYVRHKEDNAAGIPASSPVEVKVPVVAATPTATVGENEIITGLDPNLTYEYQLKPAGEAVPAAGWITIPAGTTELKLAAGTYLLRVKADQNSGMFASAVQEVVVPETAAPVTPPVVTPPVVDNQDKDTGDDTGSAVALTSMILALVFSLLAIPAFALATKMVVIPGVNDR